MTQNKSSYQKLKEENERLRQDIYALVRYPKSIKGIEIATKWDILFQISEIAWAGDISNINTNTVNGIYNQITP
jgi:hypothetical protein